MAERLPRYRPLGVRVPGVPSVNYMQTGRAEARVFETIGGALDQMAKFAYERDKQETIREAEKFAFDNPITDEQLKVAMTQGISEDDINVDRDTVFGATVLATTGKMMSADLEGQYRIAVANWQKIIERADWDPNDPNTGTLAIAKDLRGLEQGYSGAIADIDSGEALNFRARTTALGSAVYKTALEVTNKKLLLANRMKVQPQVDALPANARAVISQFGGDMDMLNQQLLSLRGSLESSLFNTGDAEFAKTEAGKIDGVLQDAKIDVLSSFGRSDEFAISDLSRTAKMERGDFGRYSGIWKTLSEEEKAKVRQNIRTEISAQETEISRAEKQSDNVAASRIAVIAGDLRTADEGQASAIIEEMYSIAERTSNRVISFQTIRSLEKDLQEGAVSNPVGNLELRMAIARGEVTQDNFEEKRLEFGVIAKDAVSLVGTMTTENRQAESNVLRIARRTAGVTSEVQPLNDRQAQDIEQFLRKVDITYQDAFTEWQMAGEEGPAPTKLGVAQRLQSEFIASSYTQEIQRLIEDQSRVLLPFLKFETTITQDFSDADIDDLDFKDDLEPAQIGVLKNGLRAMIKQIEDLRNSRGVFF